VERERGSHIFWTHRRVLRMSGTDYAKGKAQMNRQNPKQCVICRSDKGDIKLIRVPAADRRRGWRVYVHQACLDKLREEVKDKC